MWVGGRRFGATCRSAGLSHRHFCECSEHLHQLRQVAARRCTVLSGMWVRGNEHREADGYRAAADYGSYARRCRPYASRESLVLVLRSSIREGSAVLR